MSGNDEYIYRLGLDYSSFRRAADDLLSLLGKVDEAMVGKIPADARKMSTAVASALDAVTRAQGKGTSQTPAEKALARQRAQVAALGTAYNDAAAKYAKFTRNTARGLQKPGGLNPERQSNIGLARLQTQATALRANGAPVDAAFSSAINAEVAARARANAAAMAGAQKVAAAEDAAYRSGVAAANTASKAKIKAKQDELAVMQRVDAQIAAANEEAAQVQQARRMAGSGGPLQTQSTLARDTIQPTYRPTDYSTGRNTAAQNRAPDANEQAQRNYLSNLKEQSRLEEESRAATVKHAAAIQDEYQRQLPRFRYALYDVSNASRIAGASLLAGGVAASATAIDYQSLFAQVKRTSGILTDDSLTDAQKNSQFSQLRQDLVDLSKQLPVTFADITKVATLGNQLGISSGDIEGFTKTVTEFSATTDVDVESAATAFGRLGELLNNTDYRQIGDQIAYLGVKSVATEKDIIDTTTQLAVSLQSLTTKRPDQAGYAAQVKETTAATLALSTTVAGLGVRPEQARGTFIRAFGAIGQAVQSGGAKLNDVSRLSGMTADQFRKDWAAGGTSAYSAFLKFTTGLGSNTAEINGNLKSIGITAVRDRQTLGLLAQNGGRALEDLANAGKGANNDFLDKAFGVQAETVSAQLTILGNQVAALFDSIGQQTLGPIGAIVGGLQRIIAFLDELTSNPAVAWSLALGAAFMVVVGGLLLGVSAAGRFAANMIALQQVVADTSVSGSVLSGVWAAMTGNAARLTGQTVLLSDALTAESLAQFRANSSVSSAASTLGKTTGAASKLSNVIGKAGMVGSLIALGLMLPAVGQALNDWIDDIKGATPEVDSLATAVENLHNKQADKAQGTLTNGLQGLGSLGKAPKNGVGNTDLFAGIPFLSGGLGVVNRQGTGISAGRAAAQGLANGQQTSGKQFVSAGGDAALATKEIQAYDAAITQLYQGGNTKGAAELLRQVMAAMKASGVPTETAERALVRYRAALGATGDESLAEAAKQKDATQSTEDAQSAFASTLSTLFDYSIAAQKVTGDLSDLGTEVKSQGAEAAFSGAKMQTAISDIYASTDDTAVVKGRLQSLYTQLLALGYTEAQLTALSGAIDSISGAATDSALNLDSFNDGLKGSGDSAAAAKRTLADYASDLSSTFSRSYDLRFGNQDALDKITSGWTSMKDSIKDARGELEKAQADLAKLKADKNVTEYQLGIATQFGDSARAASLQAQLAQQNADIKDKQKDVTKAKDGTNRSLTGNSDAAVQNRSGLEGQIQSSQAYIQSLASGGASKKELEDATAAQKATFVKQATDMGFSKKEVDRLAAAYDDMNQIIKAVPANVTTNINSNAGAAKTAIAEYLQTLKSVDGTSVTTTVRQAIVDDATAPVATVQTSVGKGKPKASNLPDWMKRGHASGGPTANVPIWQKAGIVHGQEYVLNHRGAQMFPRQMLDDANRGVAPVIPTVNATATLGGDRTMSLGRVERELLASGRGGGSLSVRSDRVGSAMDQVFTASERRGSA